MPETTLQDWILHIDGDGFFAYCEIARFPHLKGLPVVVGEDRGIACAMTYEAKQLGITRAMPIFKIREQFPQVKILSSHFELYEHYARMLASLVEPHVNQFERYSIDECFGLVRMPTIHTKEKLMEWLKILKETVQTHTGLTYSFGLARTKVLAKVASKRQKPDGCTVIMPEDEQTILGETPIESIWGIGWRLSRRLLNMRVITAQQFALWPEERVASLFSLPVQELWHELHGRMMFTVNTSVTAPKSLQSTRSFTPASTDQAFITAELLHNVDVVFARMRGYGLVTNAISIFIKTPERLYRTVSFPLIHYTDNPLAVTDIIAREVRRLMKRGERYKSTGITVWNLRSAGFVQEDLFGEQQAVTEKGSVMRVVDDIRSKFGTQSIDILAVMPSARHRKQKSTHIRATESYMHGLPLPYLGEVT